MKKVEINVEELDVDDCIRRIEEEPQGYFAKWIQDYKDVILKEHQNRFSFAPDGAVTNPREFYKRKHVSGVYAGWH